MSNMSYCMFRNTYEDLKDCYEKLHDDDLSKEERKALKGIIKLCEKFIEEYIEEEK